MNRLTVVVTEEGHQYYVVIGKETRGPFPEFPEVRIVRSSEGACTVHIKCVNSNNKAHHPEPEVFFLEKVATKRSDRLRKSPSSERPQKSSPTSSDQPESSQTMNARPSNRPPPAASSA